MDLIITYHGDHVVTSPNKPKDPHQLATNPQLASETSHVVNKHRKLLLLLSQIIGYV